MLALQRALGAVSFAFTDRYGGVSRVPYAELNLGGHVGDETDAVLANRAQVAHEAGLPSSNVMYMNQVHGAEVAVVDQPWHQSVPDVDAMVTDRPGLALAVLVADCAPVLLADEKVGVVGVAHAGRPGMAVGVVPATVAAMRARGASDIVAWIGPAVCGACYEVPGELQDSVAALVPQSRSTTRSGTPGLDIRAGVRAQLNAVGVDDVETVEICTMEDTTFFSYRRDGRTGRFAGLAWLSR